MEDVIRTGMELVRQARKLADALEKAAGASTEAIRDRVDEDMRRAGGVAREASGGGDDFPAPTRYHFRMELEVSNDSDLAHALDAALYDVEHSGEIPRRMTIRRGSRILGWAEAQPMGEKR